MKSESVTFFLLSSCLLYPSDAIGTFQLDTKRQNLPASSGRTLRRRSVTPTSVDVDNDITQWIYTVNITVGTPGQPLTLQLDTGSTDVWVPAIDAEVCGNSTAGGCPGGAFNSSKSSTFNLTGQGLWGTGYVDGTTAAGDVFTDTITIGGATLPKNFTMGVAHTDTNISFGIMGVGMAALLDDGLSDFVDTMATEGFASAKAYSLWLNDLDAGEGSILFGGVDTSKYEGDLIMLDMIPDEGAKKPSEFNVAWTSISVTSSTGTDNLIMTNSTTSEFPIRALLDSGTSWMNVPNDVLALLYEEFGVTEDGYVPCSLAQRSGTINFGFGGADGPVIKLPISEVVEADDPDTPTVVFSSGKYIGEPMCDFMFDGTWANGNGDDTDDGQVIFGDTFLRSAYVVYDLSNYQIGLAQTVFNSTAEANIVPFASIGAPIPSAKTLTAQVTTMGPAATNSLPTGGSIPTATASLKAEAAFTSSITSSTSSSSSTGPTAAATTTSKKSGAGMVVVSGGLGLAAGMVGCILVVAS